MQVQFILQSVGHHLQPNNIRNRALIAEQQFLLTLHWLGNGAQMHGVANMHGVRKSTVSCTIDKVVKTIIDHIFPTIVSWPQNTYNIKIRDERMIKPPCGEK